MHTVCFDLTPLMTSSRLRGIGKNYCLQMTRAFLRAGPELLDGIDLQFLVAEGLSLRLEPLRTVGGRLERIAGPEGPILSDALYYALKYTVGSAYLALKRIDLLHGTEPKGTSRPPGAACIMTCHDLIPVVLGTPFDPPVLPASARGLVERLRYRTLDHVIAISERTREDLCRITGLPRHRVTLVYQGVDTAFFRPEKTPGEEQRVRELLGSDRPYFVYVGGFDARKQVPEMVEAFGRCQAGLDEVLLLCGHLHPAERQAVEASIRRSDASGRIVMPGFVPSELLPALYRGATAHLMFSRYEGFGATLLEAMACGCPVVALEASCIPETVGDAALLVPPGSPALMSEGIQRIATAPALRGELRARGLRRAAAFSWDRCAAETVAVYRRVLQ